MKMDAKEIQAMLNGILDNVSGAMTEKEYDIAETTASAKLAENREAISKYVSSLIKKNIQSGIAVAYTADELVKQALRMFYVKGDATILDSFREDIRVTINEAKKSLNGNHVKKCLSLYEDFKKGIKHGLGSLCQSEKLTPSGLPTYYLDESKACAIWDNGTKSYAVKSRSAVRAVRARYVESLQYADLIKPRMVKEKTYKDISNLITDLNNLQKQYGEMANGIFEALRQTVRDKLAENVAKIAA